MEFTLESYQDLVKSIRDQGYSFFTVAELMDLIRIDNTKCISIRHDIDLSLNLAREFAEFESNLDLRTTFCLQTCSDFYNINSSSTQRIIREMLEMGHEIDLHLNYNNQESHSSWRYQKDNLEQVMQSPIRTLSLHNPLKNGKIKQEIADYNTYASDFLEENLYISDSCMAWRVDDVKSEILASKKNVHLLIHPEFWFARTQDLKEAMNWIAKRENSINRKRYEEYTEEMYESIKSRKVKDEI